jgi:hypothetical protein
MTRYLRFICLILSIALLATGYFVDGKYLPALGVLGFGIAWTIGLVLCWTWIPPLALLGFYGIAAAGLFVDLSPALMIPAACFALLAWDLTGFNDHLRLASPDDDIFLLEKRHLVRLLPIALVGVLLSAVALIMHLKPSFELMVILVFFSVWALGQVIGRLLKKGA